MISAGVFDQDLRRLEFIRGEIREMNPIGSMHEVTVDWLNEWSIRNLPGGKVWVRIQNSIGLSPLDSAPEPDIAWVARKDYSHARPEASDVLLVIEVADSSLAYDRGEKAILYAKTGIKEYWIVNIADREIEVLRNPSEGRFCDRATFCEDQTISPLAFSDVTLSLAAVWSMR